MSNTAHLALPLLAAAQAQKHVTVNEALARLDALVSLGVKSRSTATPPTNPSDGDRFVIAPAATDEWAGRDGQLAIALNGGWDYATPAPGWRAWVDDEGTEAVYDGTGWFAGLLSTTAFGAGTAMRLVTVDHSIESGSVSVTDPIIPANAVVIGVTARVTSTITGSGVSSWSLGVSGSANRYGSGLGLAENSYAHGVTNSPQAYYSATPLRIKPDAGSFSGGQLRLAVHFLSLAPPAAI
jgi:hypothetical protein